VYTKGTQIFKFLLYVLKRFNLCKNPINFHFVYNNNWKTEMKGYLT